VELLPVPWFRVSALYSFGITPEKGGVVWTSYAEAMLGVRVFGLSSESAVDVPLKKRGAGFPEIPVVKAWVPAHHALFVEAGAMTGLTSLQECIVDCDPDDVFAESPPDATQLVMPLGGVRYVYGFDLKSKRLHARARFLLELYAQVLGPPLNAPEGPRYFPNGSSAGDPGLGGRVGVSTSPMGSCIAQILFGFGCLDGGLAVGYAPYPRMVLFEMQVGGFVY
jgi:hypothetical protein